MNLARHIHTPLDPTDDPHLEYNRKVLETLKAINLVACADHPRLLDMNSGLLSDTRFTTFPASTGKHHNYRGALVVHVLQVWTTTEAMLLTTNFPKSQMCEAFTAVMWHDCGKIFDYEDNGDQFINTPHKKMVRHVARSYAEFIHNARQYCNSVSEPAVERISHAILAHHGRLEWGSPVEPMTTLAWCLHAADMLSAHYTQNGGNGVPS
jgi:23S rRNA maturation-related 3'-5' exoribonuclease YhaM